MNIGKELGIVTWEEDECGNIVVSPTPAERPEHEPALVP
jgi:hypothetical protein